jgi:dynein heavy chain
LDFDTVRRFDITDPRLPFDPYNLVLTSKAAAEKCGNFFTVTARGITHFSPGEPAEFSTTMEHMRDAAAYSVIVRMSFFRLFLRRKSFRAWRASVNFNRFARARSHLDPDNDCL